MPNSQIPLIFQILRKVSAYTYTYTNADRFLSKNLKLQNSPFQYFFVAWIFSEVVREKLCESKKLAGLCGKSKAFIN